MNFDPHTVSPPNLLAVSYSIGQVAAMSGISVRMLRHYDEIGLLAPSDRTYAGYREYDDRDLLRLQKIISLKATGMPLKEIATAIEAMPADLTASLEHQANVLNQKIAMLQTQLVAVEKTRKATIMGLNLNPEEIFEVFGENDPTEYAEETKERWSETDAYKESNRRTSKYTKADWLEIQQDGQRHLDAFAEAFRAGLPADSEPAMAAAEMHRLHIDQWFYPCSYDMQTGLASMYIADPRFQEHYDNIEVGLAQYVHDAIYANAVRSVN